LLKRGIYKGENILKYSFFKFLKKKNGANSFMPGLVAVHIFENFEFAYSSHSQTIVGSSMA